MCAGFTQNPPDPAPANVGLIGVGLMGLAMARRWRRAGRGVLGYDIDAGKVRELAALGGEAAESALAVSAACEFVVLSLPDASVGARVLREIQSGLKPGQIVIDTTTGDPEEMAKLGEALGAMDVGYLDACVSGSSALVAEGKATVMAGGPPETFARCEPIFGAFARRAFLVGGWGAGARMKLVTNLVLGLNRAALAEGLAFARALGFDLDATLEILRESPAHSRMLDLKGEKMAKGEFAPQARLAQHRKDVDLILLSAKQAGLELPLSAAHRMVLGLAEEMGLGDFDNSAIIRAVEAWGTRRKDGS